MNRIVAVIAIAAFSAAPAKAQTFLLSFSDADFQVTPVFNDVGNFSFSIEIDVPLQPGVYVNPDIVSVSYSVSGTLNVATPSGFPSFALQRDMEGSEFYAQGSSLSFEVSQNAALVDGVQVVELVGSGIVFTFNGRENDNGRFHPALFEINADGTGQMQNSDNIISNSPFQQVDFGDEYVTTLMFDAGNTTLMTEIPPPPTGGGGGTVSRLEIVLLFLCASLLVARRRRRKLEHRSPVLRVALGS